MNGKSNSSAQLAAFDSIEYPEPGPETATGYRTKMKTILHNQLSPSALKRKLPVIDFLRHYDGGTAVSDAIAGLTVGLTVIPQAIAYADVAGLSVEFGLYSAFMGCFVYFIFGTVKDITIGPTAIMALMIHEYVPNGSAPHAVLLCFLAGVIELLLGLLNLGFLVTYISTPVTSAFTSAAAITIATSQLKSIFGVSVEGESIIETVTEIVEQLGDTNLSDLFLGVSTIIVLLFLRWAGRAKLERKLTSVSESARKIIGKSIWFICTARNALLVLIGMLIAVLVQDEDSTSSPLHLTGDVTAGLPSFQPPPFSTEGNATAGESGEDFGEMLSTLGEAIAMIPLIAILELIAIAKAFAKGKPIDASQEMVALGLCNIAGSFCQSFPTTGSFSRTAVNATSGVKTPAGGLLTGTLVIVALAVLTPYFYYIPKATLGGIIICAVIFMVEFEEIPHIWRTKKIDLLPWFTTFFACLFYSLEYGILFGIGVSLILVVRTASTPKILIAPQKVDGVTHLVVMPKGYLLFPCVDQIREHILEACKDNPHVRNIVIDASAVRDADFTTAKGMQTLAGDLQRDRDAILWFINPSPNVESMLQGAMGDLYQPYCPKCTTPNGAVPLGPEPDIPGTPSSLSDLPPA